MDRAGTELGFYSRLRWIKEEFSMTDDVNLYQSPQSPANPAADNTGRMTETMLRYLRGASPWLRFIGVIGFIYCGILVLGGVVSFFSSLFTEVIWRGVPGVEGYEDFLRIFFGVFMGFYFIIFAALAFFPALFTYNFGARIRSYLQSGMDQDLEAALRNNKSLWKFVGVLVIISLAFIPVFLIIISIFVGITAASA
jgi:hypothetical protein